MATHTDLSYVTAMANRLGAEMREAHVRAVLAVGRHVASGVRAEIRGVTGGDSRLSGARNARIGLRMVTDLAGANPSVTLTPTGPIKLIEEDTPPHEIRPRRKRGGKALRFGDQYAAVVHHPGTRGKHPFKKGVARVEATAGRIYDREIQRAIREAL